VFELALGSELESVVLSAQMSELELAMEMIYVLGLVLGLAKVVELERGSELELAIESVKELEPM